MGKERAPRTAATRAIRVQQLVNVLRDIPGYTRGEWQTDAKLSRAQSYTDWGLALDYLARSYEPMRSVVARGNGWVTDGGNGQLYTIGWQSTSSFQYFC